MLFALGPNRIGREKEEEETIEEGENAVNVPKMGILVNNFPRSSIMHGSNLGPK